MRIHKSKWTKEFLSKNIQPDAAITLTLKQLLKHENGNIEFVNRDAVSQNIRHFLNLLNRAIGSKRKKQRLKVVSVIEDGRLYNEKRMHVHLALQLPDFWELPDNFKHHKMESLVRHHWFKTRWAHREMCYERIHDARGWLEYILKETPEAVDLENCFW